MKPVLLTFNFLLATVFAACGQERPEQKPTLTEAQRQAAKPVMAKKIKVDKSTPRLMYINTNNVRIYDLDNKQIQSSGVDTNVPALEQFMKYDKVTLYDTQGDWVYVEGQARDTKTSVVRPVGGWVAKDTVEDWQPEKFFAVKDNVFNKIAEPITVYDDSLEGQAVDKITKGDTLRVLKGNGERFFMVSKQGKEGWIDAESVDTSQLVAKGFGWKEEEELIIKSEKFDSGYTIRYKLDSSSHKLFLDKFKISESVFKGIVVTDIEDGKRIFDKMLKFNDDTVLLNKRLGFKPEKQVLTNISGIEYSGKYQLIENFGGFIAKILILTPVKYRASDIGYKMGLTEKEFADALIALQKEEFKEFVEIKLYALKKDLPLVKSITIFDSIMLEQTLNLYNMYPNKYLEVYQDNGIEFKLKIIRNDILIDPVNWPKGVNIDNVIKENKFNIRISEDVLNISRKELTKNDISIDNLLDRWNDFLEFHNFVSENKYENEYPTALNEDIKSFIKKHKFRFMNFVNEKIGMKNIYINPLYSLKYKNINVYLIHYITRNEKKKINGNGYLVVNNEGKIISNSYYTNSKLNIIYFDKSDSLSLIENKTQTIYEKQSGHEYEY